MARRIVGLQKQWIVWSVIWLVLLGFYSLPATSQAKDTLVVALQGEPEDGFDPLMGWGRYGHPLFHSTLLTRDDDLRIVNDLAVSHAVSPDSRLWSVVIRDDVVYFDGTPLTAKDVAFTYNKAAVTGGKADLSSLDRAVATSATIVEFRLKHPDSTFINRLITLGIVPKLAYGNGYSRKPLGSGPFVMVSWVEGEQMIVRPNPRYYGTMPGFDRIVFLYGSEDAMFAAAKAGKVDLVVVPAYLGIQKIRGMHVHAVKSVDHRGLMFPTVPDTGRKTERGAPIGNEVTADVAIRILRGREIAFIPQSVGFLNPFWRVGGQVVRAARLGGKNPDQAMNARDRAFARYNLPDAAKDMFPYQISGGMARRVLTAAATVAEARLIVADEPTSGMDAENSRNALAYLRNLADHGRSVLLITHDIQAAVEVSDKVAVFRDGVTVEVAGADDFKELDRLRHPYTRQLFCALPEKEFTGAVNGRRPAGQGGEGCVHRGGCPMEATICRQSAPARRNVRNGWVRCHHA